MTSTTITLLAACTALLLLALIISATTRRRDRLALAIGATGFGGAIWTSIAAALSGFFEWGF